MKCAKDGCNREASRGNYCSDHKPDFGGTETRLRNWEELNVNNKVIKKDKNDTNKKDK